MRAKHVRPINVGRNSVRNCHIDPRWCAPSLVCIRTCSIRSGRAISGSSVHLHLHMHMLSDHEVASAAIVRDRRSQDTCSITCRVNSFRTACRLASLHSRRQRRRSRRLCFRTGRCIADHIRMNALALAHAHAYWNCCRTRSIQTCSLAG